MIYLFSAFLILWAITFGYVFSLHARQKRLQRELDRLSQIDVLQAPATEALTAKVDPDSASR